MNKAYVSCPCCGKINIIKAGQTLKGDQQYICLNNDCSCKAFTIDRKSNALEPRVKAFNFQAAKTL